MTQFMKKMLGLTAATSTGIALSGSAFEHGGTSQATKSVSSKGRAHQKAVVGGVATGSIVGLTSGMPGLPRSGAVLTAFREDGNGAWTGKDVQITGAADLDIDGLGDVTDEPQHDQMRC